MSAMSDDEGERRRKYFEEYSDRVDRHRSREAEHNKHALEFASNAMRAMTYLNGGGLVAIPAAVALFKTDPAKAKYDLIVAGLFFVAGLLSIVLAQACAFFVQARRAESEKLSARQQIALLAAVHYPDTPDLQEQRAKEATDCERLSNEKMDHSDWWRKWALLLFWLAFVCFVVGCVFGTRAVLATS
jgi:hypothetical protein